MAPLAPAPELLIGMKTMVPAPLKSGVTPPLVEIGRKAALSAFGRKTWHLEPPKDTVGAAERPISGRYFGRKTLFYQKSLSVSGRNPFGRSLIK